MTIRLTIHRRGARSVSGLYTWEDALARLVFAGRLPDFAGFDLGAA